MNAICRKPLRAHKAGSRPAGNVRITIQPNFHTALDNAVDDYLTHGLEGRSAKTVSTNREVLSPLTPLIGGAKLKELTAADVRSALAQLATSRSTRAVQMACNGLVRVIRYAAANDLVARNVAALVTPPKGLEGRPSKSLTLEQAQALIKAAEHFD